MKLRTLLRLKVSFDSIKMDEIARPLQLQLQRRIHLIPAAAVAVVAHRNFQIPPSSSNEPPESSY